MYHQLCGCVFKNENFVCTAVAFSYVSTAHVFNMEMAISFNVFAVPDSVTHPKKFTIFGWGLSPRVLPSSISREKHSFCVSAVFPTKRKRNVLRAINCSLLFVCLYVCLFIPAQKHGCIAVQQRHIQHARMKCNNLYLYTIWF